MKLAKQGIDIGLRTNQLEPSLSFWRDEIGLPYEELLKIGGGVHQHRLGLNGAVLKLNHARDPLPEAPSGYSELMIARDIRQPLNHQDPNGIPVTLVPTGYQGITHVGIKMQVRSLKSAAQFFASTLQAQTINANQYKLGNTQFFLEENTLALPSAGMQGRGFRYLTIQVYKVDTEHAELLQRGAQEAEPPRTLGQTARISFICDTDNNWIEISQRKSLTGDLTAH